MLFRELNPVQGSLRSRQGVGGEPEAWRRTASDLSPLFGKHVPGDWKCACFAEEGGGWRCRLWFLRRISALIHSFWGRGRVFLARGRRGLIAWIPMLMPHPFEEKK